MSIVAIAPSDEELFPMSEDDFGLSPKEHFEMELEIYRFMEEEAIRIDNQANPPRRNGRPQAVEAILSMFASPPNPPPQVVKVVKWFMEVEMWLPDYQKRIFEMGKGRAARSWFNSIWGYEEQRHFLSFSRWLQTVGSTLEDVFRIHTNVLAHPWDPRDPMFRCPLKGAMYTTIQERATALAYHRLARYAKSIGQEALEHICLSNAKDEVRHYTIYRFMCEQLQKRAPKRFAYVFPRVLRKFVMPGELVEGMVDHVDKRLTAEEIGITPIFGWMRRRDQRFLTPGLITPEHAQNWNAKISAWNEWIDAIGGIFDDLTLTRPPQLQESEKLAFLPLPAHV